MKTRNFLYLAWAVCVVLAISSCKKKDAPASETVTGYVADATMNNIMVISDDGDTLNISTLDVDPAKVPGVLVNDSVEVFYSKTKEGEREILKADSLVIMAHSPYFYITGTWLEPDPLNPSEVQGFTLEEEGDAAAIGMETLLLEEWLLNNGELLLTGKTVGKKDTVQMADTLQVKKLNADSLVLSKNGNVVKRMARKK